jgi:hypothetical protein
MRALLAACVIAGLGVVAHADVPSDQKARADKLFRMVAAT